MTARHLPVKRLLSEKQQADCGESWSVAIQLLGTKIRCSGAGVQGLSYVLASLAFPTDPRKRVSNFIERCT